MNEKLLAQYAVLQQSLDTLEAERETLREKIVSELTKAKVDKVESPFGSFTRAIYRKWTYTEAVQKIEEKLKLAKHIEQKKGKAEVEESYHLKYTPLSIK